MRRRGNSYRPTLNGSRKYVYEANTSTQTGGISIRPLARVESQDLEASLFHEICETVGHVHSVGPSVTAFIDSVPLSTVSRRYDVRL